MIRILVLLLTLLPAALIAQPSRSFFPWWEMEFTRDLTLTDQQQQQIREILRQNRTKMIDLRAAQEKAEGEVEDLFEEESADLRRSSEVVERFVNARGEMTRHFTMLSIQMRKILTKDQWKELQKRRTRFGPRPQPGQPKPPQP